MPDFFDVSLEDNYTFDCHEVRYKLTTPVTPPRTLMFNMATKRTAFVNTETVMNMPSHLTCEKIEAVSRDGTALPMVMVYDQRFYSDKSAWIMCSNGALADKEDLAFRPDRLSLTDRGFVLAFPMIRGKYTASVNSFFIGTKYFDDNWFFSGVGDRKRTHVEDLIDAAIFIKDQNLTDKVALFSDGYSGAHAALTSVLWEPFLFHGAALYVRDLSLTQSCFRIPYVTYQIT